MAPAFVLGSTHQWLLVPPSQVSLKSVGPRFDSESAHSQHQLGGRCWSGGSASPRARLTSSCRLRRSSTSRASCSSSTVAACCVQLLFDAILHAADIASTIHTASQKSNSARNTLEKPTC